MFLIENIKYKNIIHIDRLAIEKNKTTCIVGESGSGKTTLLKMLNKIISPDSGEIYLDGKNLKEIDSVKLRRKVVMLPQSPAIFNGNIRENLNMGLIFSERPAASDRELEEVLKAVKLDKNINDSPNKLSGGEKQRVALGRILLMNTDVLLLDEPSSALDDETERVIIEGLVEHSRKNKKTLIMVTHSKQVAEKYSDVIVEVRNGKIYRREEQ